MTVSSSPSSSFSCSYTVRGSLILVFYFFGICFSSYCVSEEKNTALFFLLCLQCFCFLFPFSRLYSSCTQSRFRQMGIRANNLKSMVLNSAEMLLHKTQRSYYFHWVHIQAPVTVFILFGAALCLENMYGCLHKNMDDMTAPKKWSQKHSERQLPLWWHGAWFNA